MRAMFKLMRSGCCFVFLFISSPSLPLTHPLAFHSPSNPRSEQKPICQTIMKRTSRSAARSLGGSLKTQPTAESPRQLPTCGHNSEKRHDAHGAGDDVRSVHHYVSIHLKVQLSPRKTEA